MSLKLSKDSLGIYKESERLYTLKYKLMSYKGTLPFRGKVNFGKIGEIIHLSFNEKEEPDDFDEVGLEEMPQCGEDVKERKPLK